MDLYFLLNRLGVYCTRALHQGAYAALSVQEQHDLTGALLAAMAAVKTAQAPAPAPPSDLPPGPQAGLQGIELLMELRKSQTIRQLYHLYVNGSEEELKGLRVHREDILDRIRNLEQDCTPEVSEGDLIQMLHGHEDPL